MHLCARPKEVCARNDSAGKRARTIGQAKKSAQRVQVLGGVQEPKENMPVAAMTCPLPRAREGGTLPVSISRGQDERPQRQLPTMSRGVITDGDEPTGPQEDMVPGSEFACLLRFSSLS